MNIIRTPLIMGMVMGPMVLWMLHGQLTGTGTSGTGLMIFVGMHGIVAAIGFAAALFATRLSPRIRQWTQRLHRPSLSHIIYMLSGAALSAGVIHVFSHGLA